jgi:selenocysteine-specific elongation factor
VNRGDVLALPGTLKSSYMVDIHLNFLESNEKPLKSRTRVRFHSGTSEIMGNLILLDREELMPGDIIEAQVRLDSPVTLVKDDRYVIRSYSPVRTIGGGYILNPIPVKHKRFRSDIVDGLKNIAGSNPEEIISFHANQSGYEGVSFTDLKLMTNLSEKQLQHSISILLSGKILIQTEKENRVFIHQNSFDQLRKEAIAELDRYHSKNPLRAGMPREELKSKLPLSMSSKLFNLLLIHMTKGHEIVQEEDLVRLVDHKVSLKVDQAEVSGKIVEIYKRSGLTPPYLKELIKSLDMEAATVKDVLMLLVDQGKIVKVKEELYFYGEAVSDLKKRLIEFFKKNEEITTPQFKEMTGVSRKYLIPLIEYFDSKNVTIRVGDSRKLRNG